MKTWAKRISWAALAGAAVFFTLSKASRDLSPEPVAARSSASGIQEALPSLPTNGCSCSSHAPQSDEERTVPVGIPTLADLKAGPFKDSLEKLPAALQAKVLIKLSEQPALLGDIDSLRVGSGGMLFYVCALVQPEGAKLYAFEEPAAAVASAAVAGAAVPISSPPVRHSRPGASKVLLLDFNGHVVSGTDWNVTEGIASWDCRPYDTDGDEATFSNAEQNDIIEIWERVAEDYAPFDVDVTTEEPSSWNQYKGRVLITPDVDKNGNNCPHYGAGGVAYLDVFGEPDFADFSPAWVLDYDWAQDASIVAEAASHEFGHYLGLYHDGTSSLEYYSGHNNGQISWGPIMGLGYDRNVSQWSQGDYYNADNPQDDLSDISDKLAYRPDDHGDRKAQASALGVDASGIVSQSGVIETPDDPDVFSFSSGADTITIAATSYRAGSDTWGGNLDILLELYDSQNTLVASNNPAQDVNASITVAVPAGTYYLHVKSTGVGTPLNNPPSGYTSYGSLGQYWISGTVSSDADDDGIPNEWEALYFGNITGAVATVDSDGDGADNLTEYVSGYDPTDPNSVFEVASFTPPASGGSPFIVRWNSVEGRTYNVGWSDNLIFTPFTNNYSIDLPYPANSYTDTVDRAGSQNFYRVDVRLP